MGDIAERLLNGNLNVSGEARHINALLAMHREAADEIKRLRALLDYATDTDAYKVMRRERDAARAARDRLRAVVEFYGNEALYYSSGHPMDRALILRDQGQKAREALSGADVKETTSG